MHTSGGRVTTTIGGVQYSARGVITLNPSNINVAAGTNQDGSLFRTVAPKARTAEITFDRFVKEQDPGVPLKWAENIMLMKNLAVTFVETDGGVTHILSDACFVGEPTMDMSTGEVSGLSIAAQNYKTI